MAYPTLGHSHFFSIMFFSPSKNAPLGHNKKGFNKKHRSECSRIRFLTISILLAFVILAGRNFLTHENSLQSLARSADLVYLIKFSHKLMSKIQPELAM